MIGSLSQLIRGMDGIAATCTGRTALAGKRQPGFTAHQVTH